MHTLRRSLRISTNFICKIKRNFPGMASSKYKEAVDCLNSLQSNAAYRKNIELSKLKHTPTHSTTLAQTEKYLIRSGLAVNDLDKLSIIHVSGTKGKGSTCAFSESILRHHGYKTGFYSSPHLISIRERIKINGEDVDEELFAENVLRIYDKLIRQKENDDDIPLYFRFLTIVAFHIFLAEKVDVAIFEVGIGGEFDCTNIVRNTKIVGITTLGLDHVEMLGDTIDKIAWQKAGIMKPSARAFTVDQSEIASEILQQRSKERQCSLQVVPKYDDYQWGESCPELGINGTVQKINASLAIQLSHCWIRNYGDRLKVPENTLIVPEATMEGLKNCKWLGRYQIIQKNNVTVFLDGAHTVDSLRLCLDWFRNNSSAEVKVLIFNMIGSRNSEKHLSVLQNFDFDRVVFVPNVSFKNVMLDDQVDYKHTVTNQMNRCERHRALWISNNGSQLVSIHSSIEEIMENISTGQQTDILITDQVDLINTISIQIDRCNVHKSLWNDLKRSNGISNENISVSGSIEEVMERFDKDKRIDVLVTGSLHLVGTVLNYFDPKFECYR